MKTLVLTIAAVMITILAVTAGPIGAATSNGPYYATPSWDQQLDCSSAASCPRFIVLSNWVDEAHPSGGAAVLDRETGLVWEQSPSTTTRSSWENAQISCNRNAVGNRLGWRLPTVQELASLVDLTVPFDPTVPVQRLPAGHPFSNVNVPSSVFWSATSNASVSSGAGPGFAWFVVFRTGFVGFADKSNVNFVWCVRGGHGVDPQ